MRADPLSVCPFHLRSNRRERFRPRGCAQRAVFANVGTIEPLGAEPVNDVAGFIRDPLFVHGAIEARQNAHHLASAGIDTDG